MFAGRADQQWNPLFEGGRGSSLEAVEAQFGGVWAGLKAVWRRFEGNLIGMTAAKPFGIIVEGPGGVGAKIARIAKIGNRRN